MRKFLPLALLIVFSVCASAQQNHVPNGDFEYYTSCPTGISQIDTCIGWTKFTNATTDYFHGCSSGNVGVPTNFRGYQPAASGNGYVGLYSYAQTSGSYKEYACRQIIPLVPGRQYNVSLSVSLSNVSSVGTNDIGVYFFDAAPSYYGSVTTVPTGVTPQVEWPNIVVADTQNWVRLSKVFVADSAYDNIVIGGFRQLGTMTTQGSGTIAYYYIDSVVVRPNKRIELSFSDNLCAGDTIRVPYTLYDTAFFSANNQLRLQLSNASGSFASPVTIGTKTSKSSDTIIGIIPTNTPAGAGYRLRIVSTLGADTSFDNGVNIGIGTTKPAKPVAASNSPVCTGDSIKLSATTSSSGVSWSWSGPNGFSNGTQNPAIPNAASTATGNYVVTAAIYGCRSRDTVTVTVNPKPLPVTATGDTLLCAPDTLHLTATSATPGVTYSWTGPNSFTSSVQSPVIASTSTANSGNYYVAATLNGCSTLDTLAVVVNPIPANFNTSSNSPVCFGSALNLTASSTTSGVTYSWTGPIGFTSSSATPSIGYMLFANAGDYYVTAKLGGCTLKDTLTVAVNALPAKPVAGSNTPVCEREQLQLTASSSTAGVTYSWSGPGGFNTTTQNPSISSTLPAMSGDYIVSAILNSCSTKDTVSVTIKPSPAVVSASANSPLCAGDTLKLAVPSSGTGVTYSWSGPNSFTANTQNATIANATTAASGQYISIHDLNGCTYRDTVGVQVNTIPPSPGASYSPPLCVGETLQLTAGTVSGATYTWTGPNGFTANAQNPAKTNIVIADTGTYYVTSTVNGCTSPKTPLAVSINPQPFVVIYATPGDSICAGDPVVFTALPNNAGSNPQYRWKVNAQQVGSSKIFNTTTLNGADVVLCEMTDNEKCSVPYTDASNDITMTVLPWLAPSVTITASPAGPVKVDEYITFTATTTDAGLKPKFQWKRNGQDILGATSAIWSANTLNDNDEIHVEIISGYKCPQPVNAISNKIQVRILTTVEGMAGFERLSLYPNPNSGQFTLSGSVQGNSRILLEITNAVGQTVHTQYATPANGYIHEQINTGNLAAGVYLLKMNSDDAAGVVRFVVR